jgi:ABC-type microcin C transport system duplicated ATPase subunit YejF
VGESGCGKTTTGRAVLRLVEPTAGEVSFDGVDVRALGRRDLRRLRRHMQLVFQDPFSSLNPRMTVGATVREGLTIHRLAEGAAADRRVRELLDEVGLRPEYARATRTSSRAGSGSASASPARSPSSPGSSSATSR